MQSNSSDKPSDSVFRIDKFVVPAESLSAFLALMHSIQRLVRTLPGCERDLVLTQTGGASEFNVVHLIEWKSAESVANALRAMPEKFANEQLDPPTQIRKLGVRGDFGLYTIT